MYPGEFVVNEGLFESHTHTRFHISREVKGEDLRTSPEDASRVPLHQQIFETAMRLQIEGFAHGNHMPNLFDPSTGKSDPIIIPGQVYRHTQALIKARPAGSTYQPYPVVQLYDWSTVPMIAEAHALGCKIAKGYMPGVTHSGYEITDFFTNRMMAILERMAKIGMALSLHLGIPSLTGNPFEETRMCIEMFKELVKATENFGDDGLKIIAEHLPDWETLEAVLSQPDRVGGTLTIHHLTTDASLFWADEIINAFYMCKPVLGYEDDRQAMIRALRDPLSRRRLWLGTDNAPHTEEVKCTTGSPGIWMPSRVALSLLISLFEKKRLSRRALIEFSCLNGPRFLGIPVPMNPLVFRREPFIVPDFYPIGDTGQKFIPLHAGQSCEWQFERVPA